MELIRHYFPALTPVQTERFEALWAAYQDWNDKINVISRKDIENLYERHVLHSLAIAKHLRFRPGAQLLDIGTGGGFPGIPLAILFPESQFHLIDGTRKKITVVSAVSEALGLENVRAEQIRAEELKTKYDFVLARAVASLDKLWTWSLPRLSRRHKHAIPNGLLALKGGQIKEETSLIPRGNYVEAIPLNTYFAEPFFEEKFLVYIQGD